MKNCPNICKTSNTDLLKNSESKTNNNTVNYHNYLLQSEETVFNLLDQTAKAVYNLAEIRLKCKLSNTKVSNVYKELNELIKVMAVYKHNNTL